MTKLMMNEINYDYCIIITRSLSSAEALLPLQQKCMLCVGRWLKFNMADADHEAFLRCVVCSQFKDRLISMRNFCPAFVEGTILAFERPCSSLDLSECYSVLFLVN